MAYLFHTTVTSNYIGRDAFRHLANHRMYLTTPPILQLPPSANKGVNPNQHLVTGAKCNSSSSSVINPLKLFGFLISCGAC